MNMLKISLCVLLATTSTAFAGDLHKAARKGDAEKIAALVAAGEQIDELDGIVGAPLHWAAARGKVEAVETLLGLGADPNQEGKAPDHLTPLHLAAGNGHLDAIERLVGAGASIEVGAGAVGTPLHFAAQKDHADVAEYLISKGANPNSVNSGGAYAVVPLHIAAETGSVNVLEVLVNAGVPVNQANASTGVTALHLAIFSAQPEAVRFLIQAGANPHAQSSTLETPKLLARSREDMFQLMQELVPE